MQATLFYDVFKTVIDEEFASAQAMMKKGLPAARVYETIMKMAKPKLD